MRKFLCFSILMAFTVIAGTGTAMAAKETINIMCWEGYADKAFIDDFKRVVKKKYKIDVEVKPSYATGQEDFYNAAKNGTADIISPPADMPKTPRCCTRFPSPASRVR